MSSPLLPTREFCLLVRNYLDRRLFLKLRDLLSLVSWWKVIDPVTRTEDRPTTRLNAMNSSAPAISSAFWLPEPAVEAGWEKPKTKPVQTEVEARLWNTRQRAADPKKGWIDALIYTAFAGSSTASAGYALRSLNALFTNDSRTNPVNQFFE
jgi:hypothetical protein